MKDGLKHREKALENEFFVRQNEKLRKKLKADIDREQTRTALREAYPQMSADVVDRFLDHGMDVEAVAAIGLVPLSMVAWADGTLSPKEREAILAAASKRGFAEGTKARALLEDWLSRRPSPEVVENWKQFVAAAAQEFTTEQRMQLRDGVMRLAEEVAKAAGGFLGLGPKISKEERAVLDEVERSFS